MRVGIDASLVTNQGGVGSYIRSFINALVAVNSDGNYTLFFSPSPPSEPIVGTERMHRVIIPTRNAVMRYGLTYPLALARERVDVLHAQYVAPPFSLSKLVVHVHDLIHEQHPEFYSPDMVVKFRAMVPLAIRRAVTVLTDSEYSKRDIMRRYCVPPEKVVVAPGAADPMFRRIHDQARLAAVRDRYHTGDEFILYVGKIERRKNLKTLIAAYVRLRQAGAIRAKLVLVGSHGWIYDDIFAAARESGYAEELVFTEYVPAEDLVALYNAAALFVYPSLFEGFGIPPLEAMACGTPVVCSNASSLPEVVGDAALTVDPLDVEGLAGAVARVLSDATLRGELVARGLERAPLFSWDTTARIVRDVYCAAAMSR